MTISNKTITIRNRQGIYENIKYQNNKIRNNRYASQKVYYDNKAYKYNNKNK